MSQPERVKIDGQRHYTVDGKTYPSVTTVTDADPEKKAAMKGWAAKQDDPDHVRDRAGLLGTLAHHRILQPYAIRNLPMPEVDFDLVDDEMQADVETCELLWEKCDLEMGDSPHIEQRVWSHAHGYAGTLDALTDSGTVVDLKTSKTAYPSHKMQIAAYYYACHELPKMPDPTDAAIVVIHPHVDNNPRMKPRVHRLQEDELEHHFGQFLDLLETFQ